MTLLQINPEAGHPDLNTVPQTSALDPPLKTGSIFIPSALDVLFLESHASRTFGVTPGLGIVRSECAGALVNQHDAALKRHLLA